MGRLQDILLNVWYKASEKCLSHKKKKNWVECRTYKMCALGDDDVSNMSFLFKIR